MLSANSGIRNKPPPKSKQRRVKLIAPKLTPAWRVFSDIEHRGVKLLRDIARERASFTMMMIADCYNLKRLVYFQKASNAAF